MFLYPRFIRVLCFALVAWTSTVHATSVIPLYLDEVIDRSTTAFEGTCTENHTERDSVTGFVVTYTTFAVHDVLKGSVGPTHTIKQIGGTLPNATAAYRVPGIPKFTVGEDYVVFLAGVSSAGFSSPLGLGQGTFEIRNTPAGARVTNGRDFRDLTVRMTASLPTQAKAKIAQSQAPVRDMDLGDFKQLVRDHLAKVQR